MAPKTAEAVQMITIHNTDRPAIRPACAASALFAMPTTNSATTSGMTVIFKAFSHSVPTKEATPSALPRTASLKSPAKIPATRPRTSAASA